jgi:hypothetical protein
MIPGEVIGLNLVGSGLIPTDQSISLPIWSIVCLAAVVVVRGSNVVERYGIVQFVKLFFSWTCNRLG